MEGDDVDLSGAEIAVVVGPTASGKSALALELAEAHHGEIVGADSVQVYRWFDVGSSKPTAEERARVPHHLVDVADPDAPLDAASYAELADKAIADVRSRGKLPIVCGGTYLWVRALLYGLAKAPPGDPAIRMRLSAWAEAEGRAALHHRLTEVDPVAAARLSPNDFVRVSRALEVFELSGKPISGVAGRAWLPRTSISGQSAGTAHVERGAAGAHLEEDRAAPRPRLHRRGS